MNRDEMEEFSRLLYNYKRAENDYRAFVRRYWRNFPKPSGVLRPLSREESSTPEAERLLFRDEPKLA